MNGCSQYNILDYYNKKASYSSLVVRVACGLVYKVDLVGSAHRLSGQEALCKYFSVDTRRLFLLSWTGIYYTSLGAALF